MKLRMENCELRRINLSVAYVLCILFSFLSVNVASAQENFAITNYFSPKYRDLTMMKISLIPPVGFIRDTEMLGFIDREHGAALRAELIKQSIDSTSNYFFAHFDSIEHKDSLGMKIIESFHFRINGFIAHLVNMTSKVEGNDYLEWRLFIGDTSSTYLIKGFMPANGSKNLEQQIRSALLSVFYEPDRRLLPPGTDPTTTSTSACNCHNKK